MTIIARGGGLAPVGLGRGPFIPREVPVRYVVDSEVSALRTTLPSGSASEIQHRAKELDEALQCIEALGKPDQRNWVTRWWSRGAGEEIVEAALAWAGEEILSDRENGGEDRAQSGRRPA